MGGPQDLSKVGHPQPVELPAPAHEHAQPRPQDQRRAFVPDSAQMAAQPGSSEAPAVSELQQPDKYQVPSRDGRNPNYRKFFEGEAISPQHARKRQHKHTGGATIDGATLAAAAGRDGAPQLQPQLQPHHQGIDHKQARGHEQRRSANGAGTSMRRKGSLRNLQDRIAQKQLRERNNANSSVARDSAFLYSSDDTATQQYETNFSHVSSAKSSSRRTMPRASSADPNSQSGGAQAVQDNLYDELYSNHTSKSKSNAMLRSKSAASLSRTQAGTTVTDEISPAFAPAPASATHADAQQLTGGRGRGRGPRPSKSRSGAAATGSTVGASVDAFDAAGLGLGGNVPMPGDALAASFASTGSSVAKAPEQEARLRHQQCPPLEQQHAGAGQGETQMHRTPFSDSTAVDGSNAGSGGPVPGGIGAPGMAGVPEFANAAENLRACPTCARKFKIESFDRHVAVCQKVFKQKRKKFETQSKRWANTEIASEMKENLRQQKREARRRKPGVDAAAKAKARGKWRQASANFREAMKQNKAIAEAEKSGKPLPPMQMSSPPDPDLVPCPHCGRTFNEQAAARHIPKCAEAKANGKIMGGSRLMRNSGQNATSRARVQSGRGGGKSSVPSRERYGRDGPVRRLGGGSYAGGRGRGRGRGREMRY